MLSRRIPVLNLADVSEYAFNHSVDICKVSKKIEPLWSYLIISSGYGNSVIHGLNPHKYNRTVRSIVLKILDNLVAKCKEKAWRVFHSPVPVLCTHVWKILIQYLNIWLPHEASTGVLIASLQSAPLQWYEAPTTANNDNRFLRSGNLQDLLVIGKRCLHKSINPQIS